MLIDSIGRQEPVQTNQIHCSKFAPTAPTAKLMELIYM